MERISKHISYEEATRSQTAIDNNITNEPTPEILANMKEVAKACFEPLREWYGKPIRINCFYRCTLLNDLIPGSSKTSDHPKGKAIDIDGGSLAENKIIFDWCKANLIFDQLIWEYGNDTGPDWVHISFRKGNNRNQTIRKTK